MRTVKQILAADREREKFYREQAKQEAQNAMDVDGEPGKPATPALDYVFCMCLPLISIIGNVQDTLVILFVCL